jgi:hypothetical protein
MLPTAKGEVGNRHWDRNIDANHPNLNLVLEAPCGTSVIGEDRGAVAKGTGVD